MNAFSRRRFAPFALGLLVTGGVSAAWADTPPPPDTSAWKCESCPFFQGYAGNVEGGVLYADGANYSFGRYTGIDTSKAYADVSAAGQYRQADGTYASYDVEHLGLPSGGGVAEVGREGQFDVKVEYDLQPTRLFETGATPYLGVGSGNLTLPPSWVASGSTAGMSALAGALTPFKLEYDRRTAALLGSYIANSNWSLHAEVLHQEKDGTGLIGGAFLTQAIQLPQPVDYTTDSFEAGVRWTPRRGSFQLTYTGSWFKDNTDSLSFANPYLPIVAGSTEGRMALPPGNNLQQLAASGTLPLDWRATSLTFGASYGWLHQNASFLPYSTLPGAIVPQPDSLDGDVRLSHYALGLASKPLPKLSVRGDATYDARNDHTTPRTLLYVLTDTFPGTSAVTPTYSEAWTRLEGSADYDVLRWLRLGVGGRYVDTYYWPNPVVSETQDRQSWARATFEPLAGLKLTLKGGNESRKASPYNAAALPPLENPLIAAYNYAPRDRVFYEVTGSWAITPVLSWSVAGFFADDNYPLSQLGLQSVEERRGSTTVTWTPRESLSVYLDAGYERLASLQNGYTGALTAPWAVALGERFWNVGVGGQWAISKRWNLALDYLHAPSYADTDSQLNGVIQPFPENMTQLDRLRLDVRYQWTKALQMHLLFIHDKYSSNDWALDNVAPGTIPGLLAFGLQPLSNNVNLVGLTVRYEFGPHPAMPEQ